MEGPDEMDHTPAFFLTDDFSHTNWHLRSRAPVPQHPHELAIRTDLLPFWIGEISWRVAGKINPFPVVAVAGDTLAFAEINFSSCFYPFRGRGVGIIHILKFF